MNNANTSESASMPISECKKQVRLMGNHFGSLFYHFAATIMNSLGKEEGTKLVLKAVRAYGHERGTRIKKKVQEAGLPLTHENFNKFSDLPRLGWDVDEGRILYCAYANPWIIHHREEIGKLYCEVDIAKFQTYNPKIKVIRKQSLLEGDSCCQYEFQE